MTNTEQEYLHLVIALVLRICGDCLLDTGRLQISNGLHVAQHCINLQTYLLKVLLLLIQNRSRIRRDILNC